MKYNGLILTSVVCIGANWLHHRPGPEKEAQDVGDVYKDSVDIVPPKHWAWYILTNEGEQETPARPPPPFF